MEENQKTNTIIGIFFSLIVLVSALTFLPLFSKNYFDYDALFWIGRIAIWVCLLLVFLYVTHIEKQKFLIWSEQQLSVKEYIVSFIKIFLSIIIGAIFINLILKFLGFPQAENPKLKEIVAVLKNDFPLLIFTCATAGFTEELIFRGYLLPRLQLVFNNSVASITVSSILFGLLHFGYGTIFQVLGPLMIGAIFAIHYQKFRNIKLLIFCHFFWDFMSLIVAAYIKK